MLPLALDLRFRSIARWWHMAQRSIEILIGRLITDEAFRSAFCADAASTLRGFMEVGYELTSVEADAIRSTPADLWEQVAARIDERLQKASCTGTAWIDRERSND